MNKSGIIILLLVAFASCGSIRFNPMGFQAVYHYEDPFQSTHTPHCTGSREIAVNYDGLDEYHACAPETWTDHRKANECYQDYPVGTTATPMAMFYGVDNKPRCMLVCSGMATGVCPPRAECMILPGVAEAQVGVCMYKNPAA